ncbi:zinc finger domain-containing protein [Mycolicibacterium goodii]|uniref:zinc finger domain-containing protein n=1 Tax=Mycolicibacterium goodii TaxID=134601 RepID=UPI001BDCFF90|nr:hypothetical protein [Mycolicibacterium goodii]MBU8834452.1 hypothetical protein [Mycolicibacterium goodii]
MADTETEPQDYARGAQWHAKQARARKEWKRLRELANTVPCPLPPKGCGMTAGQTCVTRFTGEKPARLKNLPAHPSRIALAEKVNQL